MREGRYIRINGNIESSNGLDTTISFFGILVEESKDASVYGFTGRITSSDETYKIIYTTNLTTLSKITITSTESEESDLTIHIHKGSAAHDTDDIIPGVDTSNFLRFFSIDRISVHPGTTITIVNDDIANHSIISGKENYGSRDDPFTPDGRISTGDIAPGESVIITIDGLGIYKLYDPDYNYMRIEAASFPIVDNFITGITNNQQDN